MDACGCRQPRTLPAEPIERNWVRTDGEREEKRLPLTRHSGDEKTVPKCLKEKRQAKRRGEKLKRSEKKGKPPHSTITGVAQIRRSRGVRGTELTRERWEGGSEEVNEARRSEASKKRPKAVQEKVRLSPQKVPAWPGRDYWGRGEILGLFGESSLPERKVRVSSKQSNQVSLTPEKKGGGRRLQEHKTPNLKVLTGSPNGAKSLP